MFVPRTGTGVLQLRRLRRVRITQAKGIQQISSVTSGDRVPATVLFSVVAGRSD